MRGQTVYVPTEQDMSFLSQLTTELGPVYQMTYEVKADGALLVTVRDPDATTDYQVLIWPGAFPADDGTELAKTIKEVLAGCAI